MKFLSDILAKAGLTVDGVVTLNNTATGQTPSANDNSTKLATTAWVRTFVQPYSLPIATASILGGIKVGSGLSIDSVTGVLSATGGGGPSTSFRSEYLITATAGQTTFTVPNGYTPGKIDLFLNGVYLNDTTYTATNSSTVVLDDPAALDDILTIFVYSTYYVGESPSARTTTYFTATNNQTVFTVDYVIGQVDIFYNGSKLEPSDYTANNGTSITLTNPCNTGDIVEVVNWAVGGGIAATRTITIDGVTQDLSANRTWNILPTGGATGDILAKTSGSNYAVAWIPNYTSQVQHYVKLGEAMTVGTAVYVSSSTGNAGTNMIVSKASNASEATSSKTIGLLASGGVQNDIVFVVTEGLVSGIDTSTASAGDPVWLGTNGQLIFGLLNKPYAPAHLVFLGIVTRAQLNNGEIFVKVQNGFELQELHDLSVRNPSDGDMIKYVASTGLWTKIAATTTNIAEGTSLYYTDARSRAAISLTTTGTSGAATYDNTTGVLNIPQYQGGVTSFNTRTGAVTLSSSDVTTALGYTPVTNARTLTINGTTYDLSANRSWTIAPDTSVRNIDTFTATANQTTFTVTGGYTVGLVDVFINGVKLAAADFTATNGTTVVLATGTGVGNIVEIIKYVSAFTTAVENIRTLTINGVTYDLTADRTWSITNASLGAQPQLNGTGLVRMSGTTVSYDNATYATESYVTTAVSNLVNAAPSTLDTLNELAAALGNDANFATTVTNSIATKLPSSSVSGTTNYLPKFTGASTIGNSIIYDNSGDIGIGFTSTFGKLSINVNAAAPASSGNMINGLTVANTNGGRAINFGINEAGAYSYIQSAYVNNADVGVNLAFFIGNQQRMFLNTSGNLGLGVTPSAWNSGFTALQVKNASFWSTGNDASITTNAYYDGSNYRYIATSGASRTYHNTDGSIGWSQAPSGTAGNAISFTQAMTLNASGNLSIGNTNDTYKLDVSGTGRFSGVLNVFSIGSTQLFLKSTGGGSNRDWQFQTNETAAGDISLLQSTTAGGATYSRIFNLSPTGAATFSSSVTAVTNLRVNSTGSTGSAYSAVLINSPAVTWNLVNDDNGGGGDLRFYNDSLASDAIRIKKSNNNVLIGTNSEYGSGFKLQINGSIYATDIVYSNRGFYINSGGYDSIAEAPYTGMYMTGSSSSDGFGALLISSRTDVARPIIFGTSNGSVSVERFRIAAGGGASFSSTLSTQGSISINNGGGLFATGDVLTTGGRLLVSNGSQSANAETGSILLGNRGYFTTSDIGAARISAIAIGNNWYNGTGLAFYTNPGPDVTSTGALQRLTISNSGNVRIVGTGNQLQFDTDGSGASTTLGTNGQYDFRIYNGRGGASNIDVSTYEIVFGMNGSTNRYRMGSGSFYPAGDNAYSCGASGQRWTSIWAANGTIQTSDARQKKDITDSNLGLDFINKLRPVSYKWKVGKNIVTNGGETIDQNGAKQSIDIITPIEGSRTHYGLIAQEVKSVLDDIDFGGYVYDVDTDTMALRYDQFIAPLIKAVQELKAENDLLKERLDKNNIN